MSDEPRKHLEVTGQRRNNRVGDVINKAREKFERGLMLDDWEAVAEAYAQQRAEVHVHFCIGHVGNPNITGHFCAVFDRTRCNGRAYGTNHQEGLSGEDTSCWQHQLEMGQAMLVNVGMTRMHATGTRLVATML